MSDRGWSLLRAVLLVFVAVLFSPVSPVVLVTVPLALVLVAFRPRDLRALLLAGVILVLAFADGASERTAVWYVERGWALAVGGGFVAATLALGSGRLLDRGMAALGAGGGTVLLLSLFRPSLPGELEFYLTSRLHRVANIFYGVVNSMGVGTLREEAGWAIFDWFGLQEALMPALLALGTLAALCVGCYLFRRFSGREEALPPLREFRFNDHLVWILVLGLVLLLLPWGGAAARAGETAVVVMGAIYLLRGLGVLVWIGSALASSAGGVALWVLAGLLVWPLAASAALALGLCDTWLDVRGRLAGALPRG